MFEEGEPLFDDFELDLELKSVTKAVKKSCDGCFGIVLDVLNGKVAAKICDCKQDKLGTYKRWSNRINQAEIPARYLDARESELREDFKDWIALKVNSNKQNSVAFLYGLTGLGKTHSAITALFKFIENDRGLYIPLYKLLESRREYLDSRFHENKSVKEYYRDAYNQLLHKVKNIPVLILDEMAQERLSYDERPIVFGIIDHRYSSNLTTILISNHCNDRSKSLENKTLDQLVGKRISSRIESAKHFYFEGDDKRLQEGSQSISKEQIDNFMMPAKILTHDDNTHQIMTWLARNGVFEKVSKEKRCQLTYKDKDGEEIDLDRPAMVTSREDTWIDGNTLKITGPICDHEDKKLYGLLIKKLSLNHKVSKYGLSICSTYRELLNESGLSSNGQNLNKLKRQLSRLVRMSLDFRSANGSRWSGPLLTEVYQSANGQSSKLIIAFSYFMIAFYQAHSYTTYSLELSKKLVGDSSAFYHFFVTHDQNKKILPIPFEKCKKLLGMPDDINRKAALRRINKSVKDLIKYKVLSENTCFKNNSIHASFS